MLVSVYLCYGLGFVSCLVHGKFVFLCFLSLFGPLFPVWFSVPCFALFLIAVRWALFECIGGVWSTRYARRFGFDSAYRLWSAMVYYTRYTQLDRYTQVRQ